jgi:hypothetical protein
MTGVLMKRGIGHMHTQGECLLRIGVMLPQAKELLEGR